MPYPTVPGRRMAYDDDDCVVHGVTTATELFTATAGVQPPFPYSAFGSGTVKEMNNENPSPEPLGATRTQAFQLVFPELREVDGYYWNGHEQSGGGSFFTWLFYSTNTTSGRDGSWSALGSQIITNALSLEHYRSAINSAAVSNVRAVTAFMRKIGSNIFMRTFHIYGEITPGETPDRLLFMDEDTGLKFDLPKDFGDRPRGSATEWQFRLKNNSTVAGNNVTLNTIQMTTEALYRDSSPWYVYSIGGDAFAATKQITSLAPEASSQLIVGRQVIPTNASTGLRAARIKATVASLS